MTKTLIKTLKITVVQEISISFITTKVKKSNSCLPTILQTLLVLAKVCWDDLSLVNENLSSYICNYVTSNSRPLHLTATIKITSVDQLYYVRKPV